MNQRDLKIILDDAFIRYNKASFIDEDPVQIPHRYKRKEDVEIAGLFAATLAWGKRSYILKSTSTLLQHMDNAPFDFVTQHSKKELERLQSFVHRTFNGKDCEYFVRALRSLYRIPGGLETAFAQPSGTIGLEYRFDNFRKNFLQTPHLKRSEKHISDPLHNSSAKRLCMFLRWMVRKDSSGIDFGIWKSISPSELCLPLDVHTGFVGRKLGLLKRKQNDWKAVLEITRQLRRFDPIDPIKYDLALFGLGLEGVLK